MLLVVWPSTGVWSTNQQPHLKTESPSTAVSLSSSSVTRPRRCPVQAQTHFSLTQTIITRIAHLGQLTRAAMDMVPLQSKDPVDVIYWKRLCLYEFCEHNSWTCSLDLFLLWPVLPSVFSDMILWVNLGQLLDPSWKPFPLIFIWFMSPFVVSTTTRQLKNI